MSRWKVGLMLVLLAAPLGAQERRVEDLSLPRVVADSAIQFFNAPSTIRFRGVAHVPAGGSITGNVAVLGGPFTIVGEVHGNVLVVNGNLVIRDQGHVSGNVIVVGGSAHSAPHAVSGSLVVYTQPLPYQVKGDGITLDERRRPLDQLQFQGSHTRARLSLRTEGAYNRVEGFPVMVGPEIETRGTDVLRVDALAVWRSESGFTLNTEKLGYLLSAEQRFGPAGEYSVGATAHSLIEPIERWGLSDLENSLSTFLLHQDYRDYYQRQGFSAFVRLRLPFEGLQLTAEYSDNKDSYVPVGSPWTVRRNDAPWRPQPLVGAGHLHTISADLILDDRNDPSDPTDGWYLHATGTMGVGGSLTLPEYLAPVSSPPDVVAPARNLGGEFTFGFLDLRRYARVSPTGDLRLRGILAGSLDGNPLPPQFQHAMGGEGSLPGYSVMSVDCGARSTTYTVLRPGPNGGTRVPVFASYGCDQMALFQAEYRGSLAWDFNLGPHDQWNEKWSWYPTIDVSPSWAVFFDAGKGWSLSNPANAYSPSSTRMLMDTGVGFSLGDLGFYWAWPLEGSNRSVNFFLRIDHRF